MTNEVHKIERFHDNFKSLGKKYEALNESVLNHTKDTMAKVNSLIMNQVSEFDKITTLCKSNENKLFE